MTREEFRLEEARQRQAHWQRWGPYLSERAWGTVREDYSPYGNAWEYLSHDHARSRAYRWNEDGIAGIYVVDVERGDLQEKASRESTILANYPVQTSKFDRGRVSA